MAPLTVMQPYYIFSLLIILLVCILLPVPTNAGDSRPFHVSGEVNDDAELSISAPTNLQVYCFVAVPVKEDKTCSCQQVLCEGGQLTYSQDFQVKDVETVDEKKGEHHKETVRSLIEGGRRLDGEHNLSNDDGAKIDAQNRGIDTPAVKEIGVENIVEKQLFYDEQICLLYSQRKSNCSLPNEIKGRRLFRSSTNVASFVSGEPTNLFVGHLREVQRRMTGGGLSVIKPLQRKLVGDVSDDGNNQSEGSTSDDGGATDMELLLSMPLEKLLEDPIPFAPSIATLVKDILQGGNKRAEAYGPGLWQLFGAVTDQLEDADGGFDIANILMAQNRI